MLVGTFAKVSNESLARNVVPAFALHHLAHAHNAETSADHLGGHDARSMKQASDGSHAEPG